jgi:hypothetical protein
LYSVAVILDIARAEDPRSWCCAAGEVLLLRPYPEEEAVDFRALREGREDSPEDDDVEENASRLSNDFAFDL